MPKQSLFWSLTIAATTLAASVPAGGQMKYFGVNLAGAEFDSGTFYPNQQEVEYFGKKGFNTIRLPFGWERLQRSLNGSLDSGELSSITTFVDATTAKGIHVILDPTGKSSIPTVVLARSSLQHWATSGPGSPLSMASRITPVSSSAS